MLLLCGLFDKIYYFFKLRGSSYGFNRGITWGVVGIFEYVAIVVCSYST